MMDEWKSKDGECTFCLEMWKDNMDIIRFRKSSYRILVANIDDGLRYRSQCQYPTAKERDAAIKRVKKALVG